MMKKLIALLLVLSMLMLPGTAVKSAATPPSVEDILNDYHAKAFAQKRESAEGGAAAYARSGSEKTLEQETVEILCNAGYEAYNVTADNYDSVEALLQTDLTSMGIAREGSYVVAISGEEENSGNPNSRAGGSFIDQDDGGLGGTDNPTGDTWFEYTHDNKTYKMRYVTVTADENAALGRVKAVNLNEELDASSIFDIIEMPITIASYLELVPYVGEAITSMSNITGLGTVWSFLSLIVPDVELTMHDLLMYTGGANWTIKYIQIYNPDDNDWELSASVEYVTMRGYIDYTYYDRETDSYTRYSTNDEYDRVYSSRYNQLESMKEWAVRAFNYSEAVNYYLDKVECVHFKFGSATVVEIDRWSEYLGYEPE